MTSDETFLSDVLTGLASRPKSIPCKYFYDERGSRLFDRITELEEYYPTRVELAIMERYGGEMTACIGAGALLVEYGSGSSLKTRVLLDALPEPAAYVPIDISGEHLAASARRLAEAHPSLRVVPLHADYTRRVRLPDALPDARRKVVYFPGSTIGNFEPEEAGRFLRRMADVAGPAGGLLIGVDLEKDARTLEAAYNDARGATAAFNKNVLHRINRELGADFDVDAFRHVAEYNREEGRIEMYLVSRHRQEVGVRGRTFSFEAGERILTEYSYKYTLAGFEDLARAAGLVVRKVWTDDEDLFSVQYLESP